MNTKVYLEIYDARKVLQEEHSYWYILNNLLDLNPAPPPLLDKIVRKKALICFGFSPYRVTDASLCTISLLVQIWFVLEW